MPERYRSTLHKIYADSLAALLGTVKQQRDVDRTHIYNSRYAAVDRLSEKSVDGTLHSGSILTTLVTPSHDKMSFINDRNVLLRAMAAVRGTAFPGQV